MLIARVSLRVMNTLCVIPVVLYGHSGPMTRRSVRLVAESKVKADLFSSASKAEDCHHSKMLRRLFLDNLRPEGQESGDQPVGEAEWGIRVAIDHEPGGGGAWGYVIMRSGHYVDSSPLRLDALPVEVKVVNISSKPSYTSDRPCGGAWHITTPVAARVVARPSGVFFVS